MMRLTTPRNLVWSMSLIASLTLGCGAGSSDSAGEDLPDPSSLCPDHLSSGAEFGIQPVPDSLADSYGKIFCKYTEVIAPNGGAIRLFAQREVSNEQMLYARDVLQFYLEPVPGSLYGADKTAIANAMADNGATLLLLKGHDGEFEIFGLAEFYDPGKLDIPGTAEFLVTHGGDFVRGSVADLFAFSHRRNRFQPSVVRRVGHFRIHIRD